MFAQLTENDYKSPPPGEGELSEVQVDAILNMRLRSLRRLEELELRKRERSTNLQAGVGRPSGPSWKTKVASGRPSPTNCGT